ncbi:MAG TPA: hypothetical protein VGS23_05835 [Thermoplasmata archaeon]|nr:hypothetical protein [Thermoplasmata archaeon]
MRTGWAVVGILVLIVGVALWYIPMNVSIGSNHVPALSGDIVEASPPAALLTPKLPYTVTWSSDSGAPVNLSVYNCGTDSTCGSFTPSDRVASGSGATGTVTWSGVKGNYYAIVPSGLTAKTTVTASVGEPLFGGLLGIGLLVLGLIFLAVGAGGKSKKPAPKPMPPAEAPP